MRAIFFSCLAFCASVGLARDLGQQGEVYPISEPSILETIYSRLNEMEKSGDLEAMKDDMQQTVRDYLARPTPPGIFLRAEKPRVRKIDLTITLDRDLSDQEGRIFASKGRQINPLDYSRFNRRIVVIDGDDPEQVEFALSDGNELNTLLVLINGAPIELMETHGRRFYFDQEGKIAEAFHIEYVPSVIYRKYPFMEVHEIVLGNRP